MIKPLPQEILSTLPEDLQEKISGYYDDHLQLYKLVKNFNENEGDLEQIEKYLQKGFPKFPTEWVALESELSTSQTELTKEIDKRIFFPLVVLLGDFKTRPPQLSKMLATYLKDRLNEVELNKLNWPPVFTQVYLIYTDNAKQARQCIEAYWNAENGTSGRLPIKSELMYHPNDTLFQELYPFILLKEKTQKSQISHVYWLLKKCLYFSRNEQMPLNANSWLKVFAEHKEELLNHVKQERNCADRNQAIKEWLSLSILTQEQIVLKEYFAGNPVANKFLKLYEESQPNEALHGNIYMMMIDLKHHRYKMQFHSSTLNGSGRIISKDVQEEVMRRLMNKDCAPPQILHWLTDNQVNMDELPELHSYLQIASKIKETTTLTTKRHKL